MKISKNTEKNVAPADEIRFRTDIFPLSLDKFWSRVQIGEGCWEWQGSKDGDGYGRCFINGQRIAAHRAVLGEKTGWIPSSKLKACHACDNPSCVRPDHLFWGTDQDNFNDSISKGRRDSTHQEADRELSLGERWLIKNPWLGTNELADVFGISKATVRRIKTTYLS